MPLLERRCASALAAVRAVDGQQVMHAADGNMCANGSQVVLTKLRQGPVTSSDIPSNISISTMSHSPLAR
jgi:hypothetical protein